MYSFTVPGKPIVTIEGSKKYIKRITKHARDANIPETNSDVKLTVKICQGGRCKNDLDDVLDVVIRGLIDANILKNKKQIVEYGANSGFRLGINSH